VTFEQREPRGVVRWRASCNIVGARVDISTDRLLLKQIAGTEIGCRDEDHEQDEWLAAFFGSDPDWALNVDRLTLTSGDTVIQLEASRD
jgi:heat shock protein HslJ